MRFFVFHIHQSLSRPQNRTQTLHPRVKCPLERLRENLPTTHGLLTDDGRTGTPFDARVPFALIRVKS